MKVDNKIVELFNISKNCLVKYTDKHFYEFRRLKNCAKNSVNKKRKFLGEVEFVLNPERCAGFGQPKKQGTLNAVERTEQRHV